MREHLINVYRHALRSGDRPLAERLGRIFRAEPTLGERADTALQQLPRGPARWSAAGERVVRRVLERLSGGRRGRDV